MMSLPRIGATRRRSLVACRLLVAVLVVALSGCEFGEKTIAPGREQVVVHAVLNPFGPTQFTVLVERSLTGQASTADVPFDPLDPIVSMGGVPISGAIVNINGAIGIEDATVRADGKGRGVYRFRNQIPPAFVPRTNEVHVIRGGSYVLQVTTPEGVEVTSRTTVPSMRLFPDTLATTTFDRENDTYPFTWSAAMQTHRYAVVIQTPYGPFQLFTPDTAFLVRGDLRNPFAYQVPRVFVPGFVQTLQVFAVDTNYFDYYRSASNPFTGLGIIDHVDGGTGVFGSLSPMRTSRLDVVAPIDEQDEGEGSWVSVDDGSTSPSTVTLYFDGAVASARWQDANSAQRIGLVGSRNGAQLSLEARDADGSDSRGHFTGEVSATALVLRDSGGRVYEFVRP